MLAQRDMNISWETVAPDFEPDGALCDLYVTPATRADWQRTLDFVRERCADIVYTVDSQQQPTPLSVDELCAARESAAVTLTFRFGPLHLATHFFVPDELEFDFWPKDIQGPADFASLLQFMRDLGDMLGKPVLLTPENHQNAPILEYTPTSHEFRYIPPPFDRNA